MWPVDYRSANLCEMGSNSAALSSRGKTRSSPVPFHPELS